MRRPDNNPENSDEPGLRRNPIGFFYDVPVYRLTEEKYYRDREIYVEEALFPKGLPFRNELISRDKADPYINLHFRDHLEKSYGGAWLYNEIIGYIRLHFLGTQVRGEYYAVRRKRTVRTRRKTLEFQTWKLAPEREIPNSASSESIYSIVLEYIGSCRNELNGRYVDASGLERIGPYVDWKALYESRWRDPTFGSRTGQYRTSFGGFDSRHGDRRRRSLRSHR